MPRVQQAKPHGIYKQVIKETDDCILFYLDTKIYLSCRAESHANTALTKPLHRFETVEDNREQQFISANLCTYHRLHRLPSLPSSLQLSGQAAVIRQANRFSWQEVKSIPQNPVGRHRMESVPCKSRGAVHFLTYFTFVPTPAVFRGLLIAAPLPSSCRNLCCLLLVILIWIAWIVLGWLAFSFGCPDKCSDPRLMVRQPPPAIASAFLAHGGPACRGRPAAGPARK